MKLRPWRAGLALAYMAGIAGLSWLPSAPLRALGLSPELLELGHVPLYAGLGSIAAWTLSGPRVKTVATALAACALFAVVDEWHQRFVASRVPSLRDLLLDGAGIAIGVSLIAALPGRGPSARRARVPDEGGPEP